MFSSTGSSVDDDEYISDAEREWRESLQQLELLLTMVVVPYMGKYFGRKCAYWGMSMEAGVVEKRMLIFAQAGLGSWNGNTPSQWKSQARQLSRALALYRLLLRYEDPQTLHTDRKSASDSAQSLTSLGSPTQ